MNSTEAADAAADSDAIEAAGRLGLATRGVIYLVSALLTARIALSRSSSEGPGKDGALRSLSEQPFGQVLMMVMAAGLAGYAIWRFVEAFIYEPDDDEHPAKSWGKRATYVGRGLIYVVALVTAWSLIFDDSQGEDGGGETARVFDLPAGRWIVLAVGIGLLFAAAYNGYRSFTGKYKEKWSPKMTAAQRRIATRVSAVGLTGHGLVFLLTGYFLCKAAIEYDSSEPESLDEAVRELADATGGTIFLLVLAVGMLAYAGFSFVEARWRELLDQ